MPTVESLEVAYQDSISAGAKASADSLNKLADAQDRVAASADKQDDSIRRATPSPTQLANKYDDATRTALALTKAQSALAAGIEASTLGVAKGRIEQTAADSIIAGLTANVVKAQAAFDAVGVAAGGAAAGVAKTTVSHVAAKAAAEGSSFATAGVTRELIVLGHEALVGNFNRIPGSLLVMQERMGNLGSIMRVATSLFTTFGGLAIVAGVAATAAVVAIGVNALVAASNLATLKDELSASRDNATGWAAEVTAASKAVSSTTSAASADTLKAAQTLASNPLFTGTTAQLAALTNTAFGLSQVLGITVPEAARKMSEGLSDPAKVATALATSIDPLKTIDSVTLGLILHMQAVGDKTGAAALLNTKFAESAKAAADNVTPLGKAWRDFVMAISGSGDGSKSADTLIGSIGAAFTNAATTALEAIAKMLNGIKSFRDAIDAMVKAQVPADIGGKTINGQFVPDSDLPFVPGGNLNPTVAINPTSGATGMMQITPGTLADINQRRSAAGQSTLDPTVLLDNIQLGVTDLQNKLSAVGANPSGAGVTQAQLDLAIKHYGENTPQYLAGVKGQDVNKLSPAISDAIERVAIDQNVSAQSVITALKQIAMQENRGQMAPLAGQGRGGTYNQPAPLFGPGTPSPTTTALDNIRAQQNAVDSANAIAGAVAGPDILKQQKDILALKQTIKELQAAEDDLQSQPGVLTKEQQDLVKGYNTAIAQTKVHLLDVIDPTRQATLATEDQAKTDAVLGDADAKLLAIKLQIQRQRADNPQAPESEAAAAAQLAAAVDLQTAGYTKLAAQSQLTIKNNDDLATAWKSGADAAQGAQSAADAYSTAIKIFSTDDAPTFQKHLADIKTLQDGIRDSSLAVKAAQQGSDLQHQIDMVKAETDTLGENTNVRAQYLAHLQAEYDLRIKFPGDAMKPMRDSLLAENDALVANKQVLADQQSALSELSNAFTQSFDTISQAMVNAFLSGSGAAVNWGNVMKSVVQQVIAEFLKLAILNPLLNSLFGSNNVTLGSVGGLFGSMMGNVGVGGSLLSAIGGIGGAANDNVDILGNVIGGAGGGGGSSSGGGSILSLLGLGNSVAGQGGFGLGDAFSGVKSLLATQIGPGTIQPGIAGAVGDLAPGATLGGALGAAGLGFGVGSLAGNFVQKSAGKTGPGPEIGAGVGAAALVAGAALAPETFGLSLLAAGLIGGTAGGALGGLIGPKPPSAYSSTGLNISGGLLATGASSEQGDASSLAATASAVNELNTVLKANSISIQSLGKITQIGENTKGGFQDPSKAAQVSDAFSNFRFSSADPHINAFLQGAGFANAQDLTTTVAAVQNFVSAVSGTDFAPQIDKVLDSMKGIGNAGTPAALASIQTFVTQTVPGLLSTAKVTGTLGTAIDALRAQFGPAIAMAQQLGYKEADLTAARDKAVADLVQQERDAAELQRQGNATQFLAAQATLSGDPGAQQAATLAAFDQQATAQRKALVDQYQALLGDTYTASYEFQMNSVQLEQTLGEQRLVVQKQFNDQMVAALASTLATDHNLTVRKVTANATLSGDPAQIAAATLYAFDVQAQDATKAFSDTLIASYGAAFATTQSYAEQMALEESTLGQERLVVQKQANDTLLQAQQAANATALQAQQAAAAAALQAQQAAASRVQGDVTNLQQYANTLSTGANSPLSPQAQYSLASRQFNAVSSSAAAGNPTSIEQLSQYSDQLLAASRTVFGSGAGYAADFQRVLASLSAVVAQPAKVLTQAAFIATTQDQTTTLANQLIAINTTLSQIRVQLAQTSSKPARAA